MSAESTALYKQMSSSVILHTRDLVQSKYSQLTDKILPAFNKEIVNLYSTGVELGNEGLKITKSTLSHTLDLAMDLLPEAKPDFEGTVDDAWIAYAFGATGITDSKISKPEYDVLSKMEFAIMNNTVIKDVPQIPEIAPKLLSVLKNDAYPWSEFSITLCENEKFQQRFLSVANSPAFGLLAKASSIEQLLLPLGKNELKQVVLITAITYVMEFDKDQFGKQSRTKAIETAFKTAIACKTLASDGFDIDETHAFITGFANYIGTVTALRVMRKVDFELGGAYSRPFVKRLQQLVALMSYQITLHWKLPKETRVAIKEQATLGENAKLSPLGEILYLATRVAMAHYLSTNKLIKDSKGKVMEMVGLDRLTVCETSFETLNSIPCYQYSMVS